MVAKNQSKDSRLPFLLLLPGKMLKSQFLYGKVEYHVVLEDCDPPGPANVHYFSNPRSWTMSDVMLAVLKRFNWKLLFEQRKVILFLDNPILHPESMVDSLSQIKIIFLPKNTTSRLQPPDAGINQNFKVKYRKRLVKYVLNENSSKMRIIKDVNILMAIQWAQEAWKEATGTAIEICFEKCGVVKSNDDLMEVEEDDLEFEALVRELSPDMSATEYVYFDANNPKSKPIINEHKVDW